MLKTITITEEDIFQQIKVSLDLPKLIEKTINRKIIENAVDEAKIAVEVEDLQKTADLFRLSNKLETAKDTHEWLEKHHLSVEDFEKMTEFNLKSGMLIQHLFAEQVEPYFYQNQSNYTGAVIYEIVFDDPDLAMELFYSIQEKEISFFEAAHQYITNTELKRKCGYLGKLTRKDLKPEISAAVFASNPPELLKPITTAKGVHLIFVEEIIKPELDNQLRAQILSDLFSEWLKKQNEQLEVTTKF